MGQNCGCCALFFWGGGAGSPSNTTSPGPKPTSVPSGILIHPAVWPQQMGRKLGAVPLLGRKLGPHLTRCGRGGGLRPSKFHLDPATVWPQYTDVSDRQDIQTENGPMA